MLNEPHPAHVAAREVPVRKILAPGHELTLKHVDILLKIVINIHFGCRAAAPVKVLSVGVRPVPYP